MHGSKVDEVNLHKHGVVYLSNLPYETSTGDLETIFSKEGIEIVHVEFLKKGRPTRLKTSGLACVTLASPQDVALSCAKLDGAELCGRAVAVRENKFE